MTSLPKHRSVQGRRPSVGPTTARRSPSARRWPGAGFLPAWRPAARVIAPRERFRMYAEDEYFAQAGQISELARDGVSWPVDGSHFVDAGAGAGIRGFRLAAGAALVAGAGALGVVLVLNVLASSVHVRRKTALRTARANARIAAATSAITTARPTHLRSKGSTGRARRTRPAPVVNKGARHAHRSAFIQDGSNARSSRPAASRPLADRALPSTDVAAREPVSADGRGTGGDARGARTEVAASGNPASRRGKGEFGFER
jgi:hypothetical protein